MATKQSPQDKTLTKYVEAMVYGAGMQGACAQAVANRVIDQAYRIHKNTGNNIEWCLAQSMLVYNKLKKANFSERLTTYLQS